MSPEEVYNTRTKLGMTQEEFASHIGYCSKSVSRWETGELPVSKKAIKIIETL